MERFESSSQVKKVLTEVPSLGLEVFNEKVKAMDVKAPDFKERLLEKAAELSSLLKDFDDSTFPQDLSSSVYKLEEQLAVSFDALTDKAYELFPDGMTKEYKTWLVDISRALASNSKTGKEWMSRRADDHFLGEVSR